MRRLGIGLAVLTLLAAASACGSSSSQPSLTVNASPIFTFSGQSALAMATYVSAATFSCGWSRVF